MESAVKLCIGLILDERNVFHSFGFLVGPRLLLAAASKPDGGRLLVQWHPSESSFPIEATNVGSRGLALFSVSESPPESEYAPPLKLDELSPEATLAIHWGEASSDAKVVSRYQDGGLFLGLAQDPGRPLLSAPVLNGPSLAGVVADQKDRFYQAIGVLTLFRDWREQPWFGAFRAELFWNLDEILGPLSGGPEQVASKAGPAKRQVFENAPPAPSKRGAPNAPAMETPAPAKAQEAGAPACSDSVRDALRWARALAEVREREVGAHEILLGLFLHRESPGFKDAAHFLWGWFEANKPKGVANPFKWFDLPTGPVPTAPAPEPTGFAADASALLARASACARAVSNADRVSMRHLVGALLLGPESSTHAHDAGLVGEKGFPFQALSAAYLEFIGKTVPGEREAWIAWARPASARPRVPTPPGVARGSIRAGYDADLPIGTDHLDIEDEVATLCSVVLDANHPPPLSIGLFGDWGSGKSFFLGKMKDRIRDVTGEARQARELGIPTTFVARAPQIEFNAWHFVDANLWASLVTHLFEELHREIFGRKPNPDEEKAEKLYQELATTQKRIQGLEREVRAADDLVQQATDKRTQAEKDLRDGKKTIEIFRRLTPESVKELVLNKAEVRSRFDELSETLGKGQEALGEIQALSQDLLTTAGKVRRFARESWVLLLVVGTLLLLGALLASPVGMDWMGRLQSWLTSGVALLTGAVALAKKALPFMDRAKRFLRSAETARQDVLRESQGKLDQAEIARKEAAERLTAEEGKKQKLEKEIEEARRGLGLEGFLQQRLGDSEYKAQLGIVAMVRQDFDTLTQRLRSPGIEILDSKTKETRLETVDRVILYIDDLDRCPPDRVVEVLQAVHLLCAVPLFVVVVAADPRWLYHSLRKHYAELLETQGGNEQARQDWEEERWESTPQQYLEKIFQIPYTLPAMEDGGFRKLVESLLEPEKAAKPTPKVEVPVTPPKKEEDSPGRGRTPEKTENRPAKTPESKKKIPGSGPAVIGSSSRTPEEDEAERARAQAVKREWKPTLDLAPKSLELTRAEKDFLQELSPLVSTPRATKRLVNVYRLLRANLTEKNSQRFEQEEYRVVQVLLGVLIGFPDQAPELFRRLQDNLAGDFWDFIKREEQAPPPAHEKEWAQVCRALKKMETPFVEKPFAEDSPDGDMARVFRISQRFPSWIDEVSRYSFRAGHLLRYLSEARPAGEKNVNQQLA